MAILLRSRNSSGAPRLILTDADHGKSFDLDLGAQLVVQLDEAPTTGYRWKINIDGKALTLLATDFQAPATGVMGGRGRVLFTISAQNAGRARLQFKLCKEWEGDASAINKVIVDVNVVPSA
jgi:inhibitor of cysteine peptidase